MSIPSHPATSWGQTEAEDLVSALREVHLSRDHLEVSPNIPQEVPAGLIVPRKENMSTGGSSLAALATSKPYIDQEIIDNLQDFTADTLTFRNEATGVIQKCEVLVPFGYHDKRAVYRCLWRGKRLVLKWWDETDEFCWWRYNNELQTRRQLHDNPYIPSIYAYGKVIQGALKAGLIIIMERRSGIIFTPRIWRFMEDAERLVFKRTLHDAFHSFREKHVVHQDAQFNVLWDTASRSLTVIDWEEMRIEPETVRPENFEIFLVLTSCEER